MVFDSIEDIKRGMRNIIQLLHLNEINMRFYGAEYNNIERGDERDQYEVLWSRVQQYWTRRSRVQYCCTLLHKTSYWSSSSVVIVLLHTALFYFNFDIIWKLWNLMKFLKVLKFYEILNFKKEIKILRNFWNFQIKKKNWPLKFVFLIL